MCDDEQLSVERVIRAFQIAQRSNFRHSIHSSDAVRGRSVDEIANVTFKVGLGGQDEELTALIEFITEQQRKLRSMPLPGPGQKLEVSATIKLRHKPEEIEAALKQVTIHQPGDPLKFQFTQERLNHVLELVRKKANAAIDGRVKGTHFWVYPPQEFVDRPGILTEPEIYDKLKDTVWWLKWYDGQYSPLEFGDVLAFIDQIIETQRAFQQAVQKIHAGRHRQSKYTGGWQPKKDRTLKQKKAGAEPPPQEISIKGGLDVVELVSDRRIRHLFAVTTIEKTTRPKDAVN